MIFLSHILVPIHITLVIAFPVLAYGIGALPVVLSAKAADKECPHCHISQKRSRSSFTADHIKTIGIDGIHAWGTRAKILSALMYCELGILTGLILYFFTP